MILKAAISAFRYPAIWQWIWLPVICTSHHPGAEMTVIMTFPVIATVFGMVKETVNRIADTEKIQSCNSAEPDLFIFHIFRYAN